MTAHTELASALDRIASVTSIIRTRAEDGRRAEANGGQNGTLTHKVEAAAKEMRKIAARLEAAI